MNRSAEFHLSLAVPGAVNVAMILLCGLFGVDSEINFASEFFVTRQSCERLSAKRVLTAEISPRNGAPIAGARAAKPH